MIRIQGIISLEYW